jgi:hypothetical protein
MPTCAERIEHIGVAASRVCLMHEPGWGCDPRRCRRGAGEAPECFSFWSYVRTLAREIQGNTLKAVIVCVCLPEQVLPRPDEPPLRVSVLALVVDREALLPRRAVRLWPASMRASTRPSTLRSERVRSRRRAGTRSWRPPAALLPRRRDSTFSGAWLVAIAGRMPAATEGLISSPRCQCGTGGSPVGSRPSCP